MIEAGKVAGAAPAETGSTKEKKVMDINEFVSRVKFLPCAEAAARYHEDYEPAYMACNVSKDDFCSILKDETTRKVVAQLSAFITRMHKECEDAKKAEQARIIELEGRAHTLEQAFDAAKVALSLISSNCDRALNVIGQFSFAAGVAATH